jgi:hypothetical protein
VLVTDHDQLQELATLGPGSGHVPAAAAVLVLPASDEPRQRGRAYYDAGQATMAMMLAAADLGIGSGHGGIGDHDAARCSDCPRTGSPRSRSISATPPIGR